MLNSFPQNENKQINESFSYLEQRYEKKKEQMTQTSALFLQLIERKTMDYGRFMQKMPDKEREQEISTLITKSGMFEKNFKKRLTTDYNSLSMLRSKLSVPLLPSLSEQKRNWKEESICSFSRMNQPYRVIDQLKLYKTQKCVFSPCQGVLKVDDSLQRLQNRVKIQDLKINVEPEKNVGQYLKFRNSLSISKRRVIQKKRRESENQIVF